MDVLPVSGRFSEFSFSNAQWAKHNNSSSSSSVVSWTQVVIKAKRPVSWRNVLLLTGGACRGRYVDVCKQ